MSKQIQRAMQIEQEYLMDKFQGKDSSLLERLSAAGYDNLQDFFEDKKIYQIRQLSLKRYDSGVDNCLPILFDLVKRKEPSILVVPSDKIFVYHGDEKYNQEYCLKNNIPVYEVGHHGGTIVGGPGDISIGLVIPSYIDIESDWVLQGYQQILEKNDQKVNVDNNDLIYKGRKVMGSAMLYFDEIKLHVANFSFSDMSAEIEKICNVSRIKQPGFLPLSCSREKIAEGVVKWLTP